MKSLKLVLWNITIAEFVMLYDWTCHSTYCMYKPSIWFLWYEFGSCFAISLVSTRHKHFLLDDEWQNIIQFIRGLISFNKAWLICTVAWMFNFEYLKVFISPNWAEFLYAKKSTLSFGTLECYLDFLKKRKEKRQHQGVTTFHCL